MTSCGGEEFVVTGEPSGEGHKKSQSYNSTPVFQKCIEKTKQHDIHRQYSHTHTSHKILSYHDGNS